MLLSMSCFELSHAVLTTRLAFSGLQALSSCRIACSHPYCLCIRHLLDFFPPSGSSFVVMLLSVCLNDLRACYNMCIAGLTPRISDSQDCVARSKFARLTVSCGMLMLWVWGAHLEDHWVPGYPEQGDFLASKGSSSHPSSIGPLLSHLLLGLLF